MWWKAALLALNISHSHQGERPHTALIVKKHNVSLCMSVLLWSHMGVWWCNRLQKQVVKLDNECMGEVCSVGLPCFCCLGKASCFNLPQESERSAQWARGQLAERKILGLAWRVKSKSAAASWVTVYSSPLTQLNALLQCTESVLLMSHNC